MLHGSSRRASAGLVLLLLAAGGAAPAPAQPAPAAADAVLGEWVTEEGKSVVRVTRCGDAYCGTIVWVRDSIKNGGPALDTFNPDTALRARPVKGLQIMRGFAYDGEEEWTGGRIYDPESGNDYSAKMTMLEDGTLELRGYILVPLFGRSTVWTRRATRGEPPAR